MTRALATLAPLAVAAAAAAQPAAFHDPLLDRMTGRWVLRGTIAGAQTTHDVEAEWVLGREYVRMREVSREKRADGAPQYEAIVFIGKDPQGDGYACLWLDNTGGGGLNAHAIGHAPRAAGEEIAFVFKGADGSAFHTTFAYTPASDSWEWRMDGESKRKPEPFARVRLTRE